MGHTREAFLWGEHMMYSSLLPFSPEGGMSPLSLMSILTMILMVICWPPCFICVIFPVQAILTATWQIVSDATWKVKFDGIAVSILGQKLFTQKFNEVYRIWDMPYLDNDLRIMKGRRPECDADDAFIFVMEREERIWLEGWRVCEIIKHSLNVYTI